jgi:hypothetical protein
MYPISFLQEVNAQHSRVLREKHEGRAVRDVFAVYKRNRNQKTYAGHSLELPDGQRIIQVSSACAHDSPQKKDPTSQWFFHV